MQRRSAHWNCILETWTCSSPRKVGGYCLVHCFKKVSVMPSKEITLRSIMTNMALSIPRFFTNLKNPNGQNGQCISMLLFEILEIQIEVSKQLKQPSDWDLQLHLSFSRHLQAVMKNESSWNVFRQWLDHVIHWGVTLCIPVHWKGKRLNQPQLWKDWPTGNSFIIFSTKEWLRFKRKETDLKKTWWGKKRQYHVLLRFQSCQHITRRGACGQMLHISILHPKWVVRARAHTN